MKYFLILLIFTSFSYAEKSKEEKKENKLSCGQKKYCKQMTSCKEAIFYLNECGLKKLDKDRDGKPCENVCK